MPDRLAIAVPSPLRRLLLQGPVAASWLPVQPLRALETGSRAALRLGPDEWLLLASEADPIAAEIAAAFADTPHCLVDVSHRQMALTLTGPDAAQTLNGAVPLDLALAAFPVGMCTRTIFEKTGITLWRRAAEVFHLEVGRSLLPYVRGMLEVIAGGDRGVVSEEGSASF